MKSNFPSNNAMNDILVYLIKRCSACKIEKTLNGFYKSKNGKYGVTHQCKQCMKEYQSLYSKFQLILQ